MSRLIDIEWLRGQVAATLGPARYQHSIAVQRAAAHLAGVHRVDWYRASVAGLTHDIFKEKPVAMQLKYIRSHGILLDDFTLQYPGVWHGLAGSLYLRHSLGIRDKAVLQAVGCHTTGCPNMTRLDKVVYLADLVSADRSYPDVVLLRQLAEQSLNQAMEYALTYHIEKALQQGMPPIEHTLAALQTLRSAGR